MSERSCIRCEQPVYLEDGQLVYCSHCGAPQIFLSEELQSSLAESTRAYNERGIADSATPAPDATVDPDLPSPKTTLATRWAQLGRPGPGGVRDTQEAWSLGVQYALLSAGVALALGLVSLIMPPVVLLMMLWIVSAPILTVGFFHGRAGAPPASGSGFGARLGLLTGLLIAFCSALIFTLSLVFTRFVFHDAGLLDSQLAATFAQQRTVVLQRLGNEVKPTLDLFLIPEYRVGMLLCMVAVSAGIYVVLSALAGGLAGLLLRRRRI